MFRLTQIANSSRVWSQQALLKPSFRAASITTSAKELQLEKVGINNDKAVVHRNLTYEELHEHEVSNNEGIVATCEGQPVFSVETGQFTGRSPKDKWIVKNEDAESSKNLWWGEVNQPCDPSVFDDLYEKVTKHYSNDVEKFYVLDGYCGANPDTRMNVRFVTELAWQQHFVKNMFIRPNNEELEKFHADDVDFTIINACKLVDEDWKKHNLNSETAVVFNIEKKVALILSTWYGGEMKKGIFSIMNYELPLKNIMAMHCSANMSMDKKESALFFGLSGTGKTTLSADSSRLLIGDDEHGWDDAGIFNFEGGCYAKTINLSEETEPEIYRAIRPGALLENVVTTGSDNVPDYTDTSKTPNSRVSYPIEYIPNHAAPSVGPHPNNIIFLTCDAFGVLPPVSKLDEDQAQYWFISGYTAKVAGTERGMGKEPIPNFSACFGAAFLTLPPSQYGDLLKQKIQTHKSNVYLVNTGWAGGPYGVGERMSIKDTRAIIDHILDGSINDAEFETEEFFNLSVPKTLGDVSPDVLHPKRAWSDPKAYDETASKLANMFVDNYKQYQGPGLSDYSHAGPKAR